MSIIKNTRRILSSLKRVTTRRSRPRLSVILIVHNMAREAPRTLTSLTPAYQRDVAEDDYEVCVVENGSTERLNEAEVARYGRNFSYRYIDNAPPSPAYAINQGAEMARGDIVAIMIDGACMLTPGVLHMALTAFEMFSNPVVMTRYFYLGPGRQNETILEGYTKQVEDGFLNEIGWPHDGYRLFENSAPLAGIPHMTWFHPMFESCCMFLRMSTFKRILGCDERFDLPAGGFLAPDTFRRAALLPDADVVQLIGEGVFHQLHGGSTTNTSFDDWDAKRRRFLEQYRELRGEHFAMPPDPPYCLGHIPNPHAIRVMELHAQRWMQRERENQAIDAPAKRVA
jgi:hypothetical protein